MAEQQTRPKIRIPFIYSFCNDAFIAVFVPAFVPGGQCFLCEFPRMFRSRVVQYTQTGRVWRLATSPVFGREVLWQRSYP